MSAISVDFTRAINNGKAICDKSHHAVPPWKRLTRLRTSNKHLIKSIRNDSVENMCSRQPLRMFRQRADRISLIIIMKHARGFDVVSSHTSTGFPCLFSLHKYFHEQPFHGLLIDKAVEGLEGLMMTEMFVAFFLMLIALHRGRQRSPHTDFNYFREWV